jgi:hypothetical protein
MLPTRSYGRAITAACLLCLATGCANYAAKMGGPTDAMRTGSIDSAIAIHEKIYEGSTADQRDLLYYLERGEMLRTRAASVDQSTQAWMVADGRILGWEDEARGKLAKSAGTLGAWLLSDDLSRYDGQDYEKVMLSTRLAENDIVAGKWDIARVEVRKMYEREGLIADLRSKQVDAIKDDAKKNGLKAPIAQVQDIKGYPVEIFNDPEVTKLRNSYQSAASHYLAGFVFEALSEPSLAAAGYRQAVELRPDVPMLKGGLENLDKPKFEAGKTDVLVMVETGWIPARDSVTVTLPVPIGTGVKLLSAAYPVIRPAADNYAPSAISIGDTSVPSAVVTNLDAMARRSLHDQMPALIARSMVRMLVSGVAQEALARNNGTAGSLMSLAVGVASAATASADTREWRTLPAYISLARVTVKSGSQVVAINTPQGRLSATLNIDGPYALVVLRPIGPYLEALVSTPSSDMLQAARTQALAAAQAAAVADTPKKKPRAKARPKTPAAVAAAAQ